MSYRAALELLAVISDRTRPRDDHGRAMSPRRELHERIAARSRGRRRG